LEDFMRRFGQWFSVGAAVMLGVHALSSNALASLSPVGAPEISPDSISAGLALVAGGVLMLRALRGSK
jgi:branched-subunit amino acid transport protein AzlD